MREAANSIANGIPSRRRPILTTASVSLGFAIEKRGAALRARSINILTAGESIPSLTSSEGTGHTCSWAIPSPSRLVDRTLTVADCVMTASTRSATASSTCSQLSITNSRIRPSSAAATDSLTVLPGCWLMPSTAATASGTAAGSVTAASSKTQTPSGNSSANRAATSNARRVLPTPPTPVNGTRACLPNLKALTGDEWPVTRMGVISDEFWAAVESLMPSDVGKRGNRFGDHRLILEGIAWRFRTGSPWRDLPADFGPWQTVWKRHHRWSLDGTYDTMFAQVAAVFGLDAEMVEDFEKLLSVDSTSVRAHQHCAGARSDTLATGGSVELQESA